MSDVPETLCADCRDVHTEVRCAKCERPTCLDCWSARKNDAGEVEDLVCAACDFEERAKVERHYRGRELKRPEGYRGRLP